MGGAPGGPDGAILQALQALTREIRALREDVRALKGPPPAPPMAGMGGASFRYVVEPSKGEDGKPRYAVVVPAVPAVPGAPALRADAEIIRLKAELEALRESLKEIRERMETPAEK
jgi:hypothetical protein